MPADSASGSSSSLPPSPAFSPACLASPAASLPSKLGIVAGEGDFPVLIAQAARSMGVEVFIFAIKGLGSEKLASLASQRHELKLTELTKLVDLARGHGIHDLILAGRVPHQVLLKQISFDFRVLGLLKGLADKKANSLLGTVIVELEKEGFRVLDSTLFLRQCMPEAGCLTPRCALTPEIEREVAFALPMAREIARLDIGQTIAVKNQIVIAVEALEGTDQLILRAGELAGEGVVVVKVSRPEQDMRFDVPVAGIQTIENLVRIKAAAICLEARRTLLFDREEAIALAERNSLCLLAR